MIAATHPTLKIELKPVELSFAEALWALIDSNRDYLRQFLGWLDTVTKISDVERFIQDSKAKHDDNTGLVLGVFVAGDLAGIVSFHDIDTIGQTSAIGYWLSEPLQGQGIITAAVSAMITYGIDTYALETISISMNQANTKSQRLAERLGFKFVGDVKNGEVLYGQAFDLFKYQITADEWSHLENQVSKPL